MYKRDKLFSKLGLFANNMLIETTKLCRIYRHEYVELEHWLKVVVGQSRGDVPLILSQYDVDIVRLNSQLDKILQCMPSGSSIINDISPKLETSVERGLILSQILDSYSIRTGHILLGILTDNELKNWLYRLNDEFKKIDISEVIDKFDEIVDQSIEKEVKDENKLDYSDDDSVRDNSKNQNVIFEEIEKWCVDLTKQAEEGKIDPVIGREMELRQVIDILLRRRQNNPILVGEAGVGKTAVVEALALRIVAGDVPDAFKEAKIMSLDLGRLQAGSSMRGEFESRLKKLIDSIQSSSIPILLFCDEAHTLVGSGGQEGTSDAVNLLKPMLARGELRMIGATTWSEYKEFIEPDSALTRRFQSVYIAEPDEEKAIDMVRAIAPYFAKHHEVIIRDSAISASVHLSFRHLPLRQLPDKAISLLDTACARVSSSQSMNPQVLDKMEIDLQLKINELNSLEKEVSFGKDYKIEKKDLKKAIQELEKNIKLIKKNLAVERSLVTKIHDSKDKIKFSKDLINLQKNKPLVYPWVDENLISDVLSDWTGIPSDRMIQDDLENSLNLENNLNKYIFGQPYATKEISQKVQIAISGVSPNESPLGVFLLTGPSGTGKTETALALSELMYGGSHNLITFNMTEFQEPHTVSILKGAPPGYVGYGKGGKLTEAVRQRPFSVILLDEFDKAHPDVNEIFYQVFDKGWMKDGEGRIISFKQCFIFLTSNVGSDEIDEAVQSNPDIKLNELRPIIHDKLVKHFSLPLLARVDVIPYVNLTQDSLSHIAEKNFIKLKKHFINELKIKLNIDNKIYDWIAEKATHHPNSGRAVKMLIDRTILPPISKEILKNKKNNLSTKEIILSVNKDNVLSLDFK